MLAKNHQLYDRGEDIRALQKFFNSDGFSISAAGPGSPGNETSIFGTNTYRTVIKFPKSNGLPATGYLVAHQSADQLASAAELNEFDAQHFSASPNNFACPILATLKKHQCKAIGDRRRYSTTTFRRDLRCLEPGTR